LAAVATLKLLEQADHSFQVPVRSGRTAADVLDEALDCVVSWMGNGRIAPAG
jgi:uncharacterized protein